MGGGGERGGRAVRGGVQSHRNDIRDQELQIVEPLISAGVVLELGAGNGRQARALAATGRRVVAVDLPGSPYRGAEEWPVLRYDGRELPVRSGSVDAVFSSHVLEHVVDLDELLDECRRVLRPGGVAVHILPTATWRALTLLTKYLLVVRAAFARLLRRRPVSTDSVGGRTTPDPAPGPAPGPAPCEDLRPTVRQLVVPSPHGANASAFGELRSFSARRWRRTFDAHGWDVRECRALGLAYSGDHVVGHRLDMARRRGLARWVGSSSRVMVVAPRGPDATPPRPKPLEPLRVLAVLPTLSAAGGAERSFVATAPGLIAGGVELHLALVQGLGELAPDAVDAGVVVHDLSDRTSELARARALRGLIRELAPDLVHATLYDAVTPAQLAVLGTKTPILVTWANVRVDPRNGHHDLVSSWKMRTVGVVETLLGWASASRYHAVTAGVADVNTPAFHVRPDRVKVAERGRDPVQFGRLPPVELDRLRHELDLDPTDRVVLAVGRQEPQKGYPSLIDAFDSVVDRRPDAVLLIAGREGSHTPEVARTLAQSRHPDRIRVLGQRGDVPALLQVAEIVVCASHAEGAAGSLIEAMASERAVVTVPISGLVGVFRHDVDALVVERDHLAGALVELLDDPERAARLAGAGREVFERRFTADHSVAALASVYRWAAT